MVRWLALCAKFLQQMRRKTANSETPKTSNGTAEYRREKTGEKVRILCNFYTSILVIKQMFEDILGIWTIRVCSAKT
jgi:uncharacterized membrane protein